MSELSDAVGAFTDSMQDLQSAVQGVIEKAYAVERIVTELEEKGHPGK